METRSTRKKYVPNLISDMAECDANYIRLLRLFPTMGDDDAREFGVQGSVQSAAVESKTQDGAVVSMRITERCRYTTMLTVKVSNEDDKPWVKWPLLEVRIYHDIKSAEVCEFERHRNFKYRYQTPNPQMFQPDEKSQINRFFGELLTYCIEHGHSLEPVYPNDGSDEDGAASWIF